jgi:hypothetical protein
MGGGGKQSFTLINRGVQKREGEKGGVKKVFELIFYFYFTDFSI